MLYRWLSSDWRRLRRWARAFGLADRRFEIIRCSELQVTDDSGLPGCELVGVSVEFDGRHVTIHRTRPLTDEDIVHELLHVRFPAMPHDAVELATRAILHRHPPGGGWPSAR